jgi:hypothetical protein
VQPPRGRTEYYRIAQELVHGRQWAARDCLASAAIDRASGTKRGAGADECALRQANSARELLHWVGCRLSLWPDEGQLQISKLTLSVRLPSPRSALPKRSQGPRQQLAFRLTESLWRIKIAHDPFVRVR